MAATATWLAGSSSAFRARATTIAITSPSTISPIRCHRFRYLGAATGLFEIKSWVLSMATKLPAKDVVIIGLGWTAAILAHELTDQGLDVVAIERGPWRDTATSFNIGYAPDELRYAVRMDLFQRPAQTTYTFRNNDSQTALPIRQWGSFQPGNGVGGAGVHWN